MRLPLRLALQMHHFMLKHSCALVRTVLLVTFVISLLFLGSRLWSFISHYKQILVDGAADTGGDNDGCF